MNTWVEHLSDDVTLYLGDCRDILPTLGKVDAVVTDPPYGIGIAANGRSGGGGTSSAKWKSAKTVIYDEVKWDCEPADQIIELLIKGGLRLIVWGGNYYAMPASSRWLVWDKETNGNLADCELAWTNLPGSVRRIRHLWNGFARKGSEVREGHPTQKPIEVMRWCLGFLPDARTILDPFMGSGTTGVACVQLGRKFIGIELEPRYFDIACRRIGDELKRPRLPLDEPKPQPVQEALL